MWSVEEWVWFDIVESVVDLSCYFDIVNTDNDLHVKSVT